MARFSGGPIHNQKHIFFDRKIRKKISTCTKISDFSDFCCTFCSSGGIHAQACVGTILKSLLLDSAHFVILEVPLLLKRNLFTSIHNKMYIREHYHCHMRTVVPLFVPIRVDIQKLGPPRRVRLFFVFVICVLPNACSIAKLETAFTFLFPIKYII